MMLDLEKSSLEELRSRWGRARLAAINTVSSESVLEEECFFAKMHLGSDSQYESLLKILFLHSRNLGRSYQAFHNLVWERDDFREFFLQGISPCLMGEWLVNSASLMLTRLGCEKGLKYGHRYCQYWREAVDGLVLGLGDEVGFARHHCVMAGDFFCKDVFFEEKPFKTEKALDYQIRLAPIPEEMRQDLFAVRMQFLRREIQLDFLGLEENNLVYRVDSQKVLTCGSAGGNIRKHLEQKVRQKFPHLVLKDASPVAVYGEGA